MVLLAIIEESFLLEWPMAIPYGQIDFGQFLIVLDTQLTDILSRVGKQPKYIHQKERKGGLWPKRKWKPLKPP